MAAVLIFLGVLIFCAHLLNSFSARKGFQTCCSHHRRHPHRPRLRIVHPDDFGDVAHVFSTLTLIFILLDGG